MDKSQNNNKQNQIIEETAMQMLSSGAYEFVTILDLMDELETAGQRISYEDVETCMDGLTRNSDWTWQPMLDSPDQRLYSKGGDTLLHQTIDELFKIHVALHKKGFKFQAHETWQIAAEVQRNMILKQQTPQKEKNRY